MKVKKFLNAKFLIVFVILAASFLRLYKLSVNPPSLFGDELDLGYQAYSILKTGRDYQGNFMPLHFHSLAEWRTPLYLYSAVPTVAIFGITPLGVRLPAAIFGILSIYVFYLFIKELKIEHSLKIGKWELKIEDIAAPLLAISPWHLQYSRAGFEVTLLLLLLLLGLYLFIKSLSNPKWLWVAVVCLVATPLVYSTAKLFTPMLLAALFVIWKKEIFSLPKRHILYAVIAGLVIGLPITTSTIFGGGAQRFGYISIFTDPVTEPEIGNARLIEARVRGETGEGLSPSFSDRVFNNKFTYVGNVFIKNYLQAFSTDFLFNKGDPNPRQSVGMGELYRIDFFLVVLGIVLFFTAGNVDRKIKYLILVWMLLAPIPAALTRDGGNHATRLILMLPPLIFLISYAAVKIFNFNKLMFLAFLGIWVLEFVFYFHNYHTSYPWRSERWWHYGWGPAISEIKKIDADYDRVIISNSGEPAWIFFAGNYMYDPKVWQEEYPIGNDVEVPGFGSISHTGKFYFGIPDNSVKIYGIGRFIDSKTLYLANASEVGANLMMEPDRVPEGLNLIKNVPFPSGEPAFYLFAGTK